MRQINFLPPELKEHELKHRMVPLFVVAIIGSMVAVLLPWWMLRSVNHDLESQVASQQVTLGLTPSLASQAQAAQSQSATDDLIMRTKTLNLLSSKEINWSKAFLLVEDSVPKDIVLSTYSFSNAPGGITLHMGGTAPSNLSFAAFVDALKANTALTKVVVDGFTYAASNGSVTFAVTLGVKPVSIQFSPS